MLISHLWKHRLDVPPPILREDDVLGPPSFPFSPLSLLCKEEQLGVDQTTFSIENELFWYLLVLLLILVILIVLFLHILGTEKKHHQINSNS